MDNLDDERNRDLDITLGGINTSGGKESIKNTESIEHTENTESTANTESTENTDTIEDTATEEVYETVEEQEEYTQEPIEGEEVHGVPIPEEDHRADEVLSGMALDTVRGHYTFFDLAVLITTVFAIALTLLLMRETDRYGEDNVKLSFESFMDGSYTQAMSNRYISRMNIDTLKEKIENITGHLYGFGGMVQALPDDEISPDDTPNAGYVTNFPEYTTTTTTAASSQVTTGEVSAVVDPELTGTAVTMKPSSITVETSFTGRVSIYTTLTSEFTSTGAYKPTATKPKTTKPTATKSEATKSDTSKSKPTKSETKPPQSVSQSATPTSSETTPTASETTPDTPSETSSETTPQTPEVTETPPVTTTPPETPAP